MTQPEETTAALIARLHEELKESKAERAKQCQVSVDTIENLCRLHAQALDKELVKP